MSASGTFIQKMPRQPSSGPPIAIIRPPSVGPKAVARPMVAPNSPNALPRSAPVEELLDEAEHLRHLDAGGHALQQPGDQQHLDGGRERRHQAREGEEAEADDEERLARALVADAPGGNEREPERRARTPPR